MQRHTVIAEIFGYLVCLFTVLVFFMSVRGVVNGVFGVINPVGQTRVMFRTGMGPGRPGNTFFWHARAGHGMQVFGHAGTMQGPMAGQKAGPDAMPVPSGMNITAMRTRAMGDARYGAASRLVLAIVMLALSFFVFRRTFDWLNRAAA